MAPTRVYCVIVTAFPPELTRWTAGIPLGEAIRFPQSAEPNAASIRLNRTLGILGVTSGMGPFRAAITLTALGYDDRFDRSADFVVAGISGVDPTYGSIASVFLARYLVGLGGGYDLDGVGSIPEGRSSINYGPPFPSERTAIARGNFHRIDELLLDLAYAHSSTVRLADTARLRRARAYYTAEPAAQLPPSVRLGATSVTGETFWAGRQSTEWARNCSRYYSGGALQGIITQEEDLAYASALKALHAAGRVNASRLLVLRSASDYSYAPDGQTLEDWFFHSDEHMCMAESLENLYAAGSAIVFALLTTDQLGSQHVKDR